MTPSLAGVLLLALALPAAAAPAAFEAMDADRDGRISAAEHAAGAKKMFRTMDANRDDKVTAAEMGAAHQKITGRKASKDDMSAAEKIKVVDGNGDGVLTAVEHEAASKTMFQKMDANSDGYLSQNEWAAGHAALRKQD